jgi:transposase
MATIQGRRRGKSTYYYLVESRRVNGKPRPIILQYLGTAEGLAARLEQAEKSANPLRAEVVDFGAVAALWDLADRLDLVSLVDRHAPKRRQGASIGQYITLAAINRCVATTSKARLAEWYGKTALSRLCPVRGKLLAGQRFWDAMDHVTPDTIRAVEAELSRRIVEDFELDLRTLCFDCTNFDTYIDSTNAAELPQRGHAKSKRMDLRIVGLALMVSVDGMIPLFSQIYPGNQADSVTFRGVTDELVARYRLFAREAEHVTLVFDKGNNSEENLAAIDGSPYHVIGSLVPTQHNDLLGVPLEEFAVLDDPRLDGVIAYRTKKEVFGRQWTIVVTRSEELLAGQLRGIAQHLAKRKKRFLDLRKKLTASQKPGAKGKGYTWESLSGHAKKLGQGQYLKDLLEIEVREEEGKLAIFFREKPWVMDQLIRTVLGKRILFTDNDDWTTEDIVVGYRSQHHVEAAFRQMKDRYYVSMEPIRHWTDQQIRVHAFICVLALTLASLLRREVARKGIALTVDAMMDQLAGIQEVVNLYPAEGAKGGRPRARRVLTSMTHLQEQLYRQLDLGRFHRR